ncbi:Fe-S cluster assembly protein SufD [Alteromonas sp. BL110]|uniref:Fe-S cluster assembly protein SufD n=1 Tax=Alteromonas sp. BL110 TaxID=1714845 RepID=UPI000E557A2B|nr:Fe-S cluster assembly protein SufD [Alteromonas sp. BL110]AXT39695.1 Fe-S cluster assembly protein SufD [Alteromonas sp. BL110]RKM81818.1 Fe-S cluster assembly protein SufD [Alteromonas sp. BL110]
MSQWLEQVIDSAQRDDYLSPVRQQALTQLKADGWPARRSESWRFTPLTPVEKREAKQAVQADSIPVPAIDNLNAIDLVFVDGVLITQVNTLDVPSGMTITSLNTDDAATQQAISSVYGQVKPTRHMFGLVNDALCQHGIFINVEAGVKIDTPVRIVNMASRNVDAHTRVVVKVAEGASATVIEQGFGDTESLTTAFAEYDLADDAHLEHYRFAMFTGKAKQLGGSHFKLHNRTTLNSTMVGYGSELSRLDVDIHHAGEFADAKMNAIYLLAEGELFDLHSTIEHAMPNGTTEENARGIVGDKARAVFNGRIHIHRDAQKTLAELNNRNLLLSRRGVINTKPELEIYADDVKCAHGATVAEIEEEALYYMLTRGIPRSKALVMLNFGFIQELINDVPNVAVREWLAPILSERFAQMEVK